MFKTGMIFGTAFELIERLVQIQEHIGENDGLMKQLSRVKL
jgi:hypothetical protein